MAYVVCEKRRGNPKVNVEVCRRKCKFTEACKSYGKYLGAHPLAEPPVDAEVQASALSHHEGTGKEVQVA